MLTKLNALTIAAFLSVTGLMDNVKAKMKEFANDERGLSGVVVAILLILVAVLAVVMIWGFLGDYLKDVWDRITAADTIGP